MNNFQDFLFLLIPLVFGPIVVMALWISTDEGILYFKTNTFRCRYIKTKYSKTISYMIDLPFLKIVKER